MRRQVSGKPLNSANCARILPYAWLKTWHNSPMAFELRCGNKND